MKQELAAPTPERVRICMSKKTINKTRLDQTKNKLAVCGPSRKPKGHQQFLHAVRLENIPMKRSTTQPSTSQNLMKSKTEAVQRAKMYPRGSPDQPRDVQERPRSAQEPPKRRPREPKSRPRVPKSQPSDAQELPKRSPDPSKIDPGDSQDEFLARFLWQVASVGLLVRFCVVFDAFQTFCAKT